MNNQYKVFVADIDGTLAGKGEAIMPLTRDALNELHKRGVKIGLATGRPVDKNILRKAQDWELDFDFDFCIGANGSELYDIETGETDRYYYLKKETLLEILQFMDIDNISNALVYNDGYSLISALRIDDFLKDSIRRNNSHVETGDIYFVAREDVSKLEVQLLVEQEQALRELCEQNKSPEWTVTKTFDNGVQCSLEFHHPAVNKGLALTKYMERHNYAKEDVIAFGDMENDIALLETAGFGVCLLNGSDATKAVASAVTEHPVTDDGVGHYLFDHILNND